MNVIGYSERGLVNALFYEMARLPQEKARDVLQELLTDEARFPFTDRPPPFGQVEVLLEQSFSDFGNADALVLIDGQPNRPCSMFIEVKVKTCQLPRWQVAAEFSLFQAGLALRASSSNLFTQLYHKVRLVQGLRQGGIPAVKHGIEFPPWSSKQRRRIGRNDVVLGATALLEAKMAKVFYLMIVPDSLGNVAAFFPNLLNVPHETLRDAWDVSTYGFLTWEQIKAFCERNQLARVLEAFRFNQGQIY
jgi:hypothetical protein